MGFMSLSSSITVDSQKPLLTMECQWKRRPWLITSQGHRRHRLCPAHKIIALSGGDDLYIISYIAV
jgi:hypothetical protein